MPVPLGRLRFLQLGDFHWPDLTSRIRDLDCSDDGLSPVVSSSVGSSPMNIVFRKISDLAARADSILVTGDITSKNDKVAYRACLQHLQGLFGTHLAKVRIVCGNHDVNREMCREDSLERFADLNTILCSLGYHPMPEDHPVVDSIATAVASATLVSLNSCIGCGAKRYLNPLKLRGAGRGIRRYLARHRDAIYETLDTPAFLEDQLHEAVSAVGNGDKKSLPVILAHHNLLPQVTPRLAPYGELANGGQARFKLLSLKRPVLYVHGHVHASPVEVVTTSERSSPPGEIRVVSVGAPEIAEGFNEIVVEYNTQGYPLGCVIKKWRREASQEMEPFVERVPFFSNLRAARAFMTRGSQELLKLILVSAQDTWRIDDLAAQSGQDVPALEGLLTELRWYSAIQIDDDDEDGNVSGWTVRRVIA